MECPLKWLTFAIGEKESCLLEFMSLSGRNVDLCQRMTCPQNCSKSKGTCSFSRRGLCDSYMWHLSVARLWALLFIRCRKCYSNLGENAHRELTIQVLSTNKSRQNSEIAKKDGETLKKRSAQSIKAHSIIIVLFIESANDMTVWDPSKENSSFEYTIFKNCSSW